MEKGIPIFFYKNAVGATFNAMFDLLFNESPIDMLFKFTEKNNKSWSSWWSTKTSNDMRPSI